MNRSIKDIKDDLKARSDRVSLKVNDLFGDHVRDIDFSFINLFTLLFYHTMRHKPDDPLWSGRDRLIISDLKVIPSVLALMADTGYISWKDCRELVIKLPRFFSNPNVSLTDYPAVDFITNSPYLGMIQSMGYALSGRQSRSEFRVFHVLTDRRSTNMQDALLAASKEKLCNLFAIIPFIDLQKRSGIMHFWFSMGWQPEEARFEELGSIFDGLLRVMSKPQKPSILLG